MIIETHLEDQGAYTAVAGNGAGEVRVTARLEFYFSKFTAILYWKQTPRYRVLSSRRHDSTMTLTQVHLAEVTVLMVGSAPLRQFISVPALKIFWAGIVKNTQVS